MNNTLRNAQLAYDHQLPDDSPTVDDWLETDAGDNWLYDSARDLIRGVDLKIGGRTVLSCSALHESVHDMIAVRIAEDHDRFLAQAFIWSAGGADPQNLLAAIIKPIEIEQIAESLVLQFAEQYLESLTDQAMDKGDI